MRIETKLCVVVAIAICGPVVFAGVGDEFSDSSSNSTGITSSSVDQVGVAGASSCTHPLFMGRKFPVGDGPISAALGDFNSDGYLDLVSANRNSDDISILFGLGDGTFTGHTSYPAD